MSHGNARLTVHGRRLIVRRHQLGWRQAHIAAAMGLAQVQGLTPRDAERRNRVMSDRPVSRRPRQQSASHPSPSDAVEAARAAEQGAPAENAPRRAGDRRRRRGNGRYAPARTSGDAGGSGIGTPSSPSTPLIGLKGVGLLNSYTVWTDRREESPHRGYAFPPSRVRPISTAKSEPS